jgi:N-dimethylarginine dimethylaminohydrolase
MITAEQIKEHLARKEEASRLTKQVKEFDELLKREVKANKGEAVNIEGYEVTITVGKRTGCAGHETFKEILGDDAYQTLCEKGLINTTSTEKLGVKKI